VAGGMVWRCRGTNSIARRSPPCQAASVRGPSNQELSEVLRAGRASTAGLSPLSTPDSFLMCSVNFAAFDFTGLPLERACMLSASAPMLAYPRFVQPGVLTIAGAVALDAPHAGVPH
jgi:hypothetical protein